MSEKGKYLAERIIEICRLMNTPCPTVGHCDTCKVPSGDEKGGHRDAMTAAATTHTPGKTALETPEGLFDGRVGITCPMCKKYFGVELAPGKPLSEIKTVDLYHMVYEDEPAHAVCSACGRDVSLTMTYMHGEEHELIAECLEHGKLPAAGNEKPEGIVWLKTMLTGETCGPCVHRGPDFKPLEGAWDKYCNDCKTARSNFKAPSGDGKGGGRTPQPSGGAEPARNTGCDDPAAETPEGTELIAWCDEHGRETVKKIMFGHFDSKVSGFTLFFKCGRRDWYKLPFLLDPVFTRPSKSSDGEHAGAGYGAQGEPAPPNHQTSFLGLETPASKSSEGRLCKRLNAIDDSRCERPEDDPIHDPSIAGSHVYDPLPPDDSIDTCCYICAVHPYAWIECKGTRGDGDCSKCTPCPIFKPRSPAAELGNGTGAQREAATPGLPTSAGHETPTPSVTAGDHEAMWWYGIHIPTLVKIKEVINSDEYLSKNIAAAEGLSLVNEIIDRYIKLPAAATGAAAVTPIVGSAPALAETAGDLKAKLAEMTKFRDNAVSHYNDKCEEVRDLQAKLAEARTERCTVECQQRILNLQAKLAAEKKDREDAQFEGHRLRAQLAAAEPEPLKMRRLWLEGQYAQMKARIAQLEKELAEAQETKGKYRKELSALEASLAAAEEAIEALSPGGFYRSEKLRKANERIASLEQKYTALEKDYNAAYEKLATAEKREATEHDNWLSADINWKHEAYVRSQLEERCRQYHARISTLEKELAEAKANLKAEEKRYYEEQMKVTDLQARLAAAEARFCKPAECIRIASLEAALRQRCDECPHDTDDNLCKHCLWYGDKQYTGPRRSRPNPELEVVFTMGLPASGKTTVAQSKYKHPSGDDFEKCYEEDRKTIESLLAQRDKLANEVNRLQTALDGAADLMIGGVEGPVESAITPGVYWTREKSRTRNDLRKKHNLPEWLVYQMEWDGHHWSNKSGWTHITMEQFIAGGWQLGPPVEGEPTNDKFHEVK